MKLLSSVHWVLSKFWEGLHNFFFFYGYDWGVFCFVFFVFGGEEFLIDTEWSLGKCKWFPVECDLLLQQECWALKFGDKLQCEKAHLLCPYFLFFKLGCESAPPGCNSIPVDVSSLDSLQRLLLAVGWSPPSLPPSLRSQLVHTSFGSSEQPNLLWLPVHFPLCIL